MPKTLGVIIMGGQASRLGGTDKGAIIIGDTSCFERTREALGDDVDTIAICAGGRALPGYAQEFTAIDDWPAPEDGKKGGAALAILGALHWASEAGFTRIITSPVDTPFLPKTYAARLMGASQTLASGGAVLCSSAGYDHGLHAIWPVSAFEAIKKAVLEENLFKIGALHSFISSHRLTFDHAALDLFLNLNTPQDIEKAQEIANVSP